jgi:hypothetical protein
MAKRFSLGTPPAPTETRNTLAEPELAPAAPEKVDRRTLRRTGRDTQLNIPVSEHFREDFRKTCQKERLTAWQLLNVAYKAFKALEMTEKARLIDEVVQSDPAGRLNS